MNTIPVDTLFGLYTLGNGMVPISAHPVLADRLSTLVCSGVPFLHPPAVGFWEASTAENRYIPMDLEPGQIGWEVTASCVALDNSRDSDGAILTEPVLEVALYTEDLGTVLSVHAVDLPVPILDSGTVSVLETPGAASKATAGTARIDDPASREGLLMVASATRSIRHCVLVVAGTNVGVVWLQLIPVWDHATPISDMGA